MKINRRQQQQRW